MKKEFCDVCENEDFEGDAWFERKHVRADISSVYLEDNKENLSDILFRILEKES